MNTLVWMRAESPYSHTVHPPMPYTNNRFERIAYDVSAGVAGERPFRAAYRVRAVLLFIERNFPQYA